MGAWIETDIVANELAQMRSHPVWVRGLKLLISAIFSFAVRSHPVWVRGLKQVYDMSKEAYMLSHPVWVRGLKQRYLLF